MEKNPDLEAIEQNENNLEIDYLFAKNRLQTMLISNYLKKYGYHDINEDEKTRDITTNWIKNYSGYLNDFLKDVFSEQKEEILNMLYNYEKSTENQNPDLSNKLNTYVNNLEKNLYQIQ